MQLTPSLLLQDPEAGNEATGELLARQFGLLGSCLEDQAPAVRAGAVQGTCVLLHRFWELVPAGTSASFLNRLAGVCFVMPRGACDLSQDRTIREESWPLTSRRDGHRAVQSICVLLHYCSTALRARICRCQRSTGRFVLSISNGDTKDAGECTARECLLPCEQSTDTCCGKLKAGSMVDLLLYAVTCACEDKRRQTQVCPVLLVLCCIC